jgi:hypothetical protein
LCEPLLVGLFRVGEEWNPLVLLASNAEGCGTLLVREENEERGNNSRGQVQNKIRKEKKEQE